MNKVKLENPLNRGEFKKTVLPVITHILPYYISQQGGKYFHRVRSARNHALGDKGYTHTSVSFWCGNSGFLHNGKGRLYSEIPVGGMLCATCEGRAIGAGEDGVKKINGREVMYSPRKEIDRV